MVLGVRPVTVAVPVWPDVTGVAPQAMMSLGETNVLELVRQVAIS